MKISEVLACVIVAASAPLATGAPSDIVERMSAYRSLALDASLAAGTALKAWSEQANKTGNTTQQAQPQQGNQQGTQKNQRGTQTNQQTTDKVKQTTNRATKTVQRARKTIGQNNSCNRTNNNRNRNRNQAKNQTQKNTGTIGNAGKNVTQTAPATQANTQKQTTAKGVTRRDIVGFAANALEARAPRKITRKANENKKRDLVDVLARRDIIERYAAAIQFLEERDLDGDEIAPRGIEVEELEARDFDEIMARGLGDIEEVEGLDVDDEEPAARSLEDTEALEVPGFDGGFEIAARGFDDAEELEPRDIDDNGEIAVRGVDDTEDLDFEARGVDDEVEASGLDDTEGTEELGSRGFEAEDEDQLGRRAEPDGDGPHSRWLQSP